MAAVENIMGFPVTAAPIAQLLEEAATLIGDESDGPAAHVACIDPHTIMLALANDDYAAALKQAWRLLPDGTGIALASRYFGKGMIRERIAGPDFFESLSYYLNEQGNRDIGYFFLGSTDETLRRIEQRMRDRFPRIPVAGVLAPPFRESFSSAEQASMVAAVNGTGAKVLWVGMTAPKQEIWAWQNAALLKGVRIVGSIGAAFDYFAESRRRAPLVIQKMGLESHWRVLQQPRAGGRRIVNTYRFCARLLSQRRKPEGRNHG